ncbi:MAG: lysoplasmalogenase [Roseovarius sp.]
MTGLPVAAGLTGAVLAIVYGAALVAQAPGRLRSVVKTGAVVALGVAALACGAPWLLVAALGASATGDWMLSRPGEGAFLTGVGAFAAAHLAYIALFLSVPDAGGVELGLGGVFAGAALTGLGLGMAAVLWPRVGPLRGPVMAYVAIILVMGWAALMVPGSGALRLVLPAALLFVASDTVLALERFVIGDTHRAAPVLARIVWVSYWNAQALFALAFCLQSLR